MNTATSLEDDQGNAFPVSMMGAGRMDLSEAIARDVTVRASAADGSVGVSFGSFVVREPTSVSRRVVVHNRGADPVTYQLAAAQTHPLEGVGVSVTPEVLTVSADGEVEATVTLVVDPSRLGAPGPDPLTPPTQDGKARHHLNEAAGLVYLTDLMLQQSLTLPFHGVVRAASELRAAARTKCTVADRRATMMIELAGPSAHPEPAISAFELGTAHPPRPEADLRPSVAEADVRAIGAASSYGTAPNLAETILSFGLAITGEWTTPARGPYHPVGIYIDTDLDGEADYYTLAEPLTRNGPYADVLLSVTYDAESRQPIDSSGYANLLPADELATQPFYNSVLALSVPAAVIGLTEERSTFGYAGFANSRDPEVDREVTEWARFDATRPSVDATASSVEPGLPLYGSQGPLRIDVDLTDIDGRSDRRLLLMHHTNVAGARHEVLALEDWEQDALVLRHYTTPTTDPGGRIYARLTVENRTDQELSDIRLEGELRGGAIELVSSSHGACARQGRVACSLGQLAPDATAEVSVQAIAATSLEPGEAAELDVTMSASDGCEVTFRAASAVPVLVEPALTPGGGCSCRLSRSDRWPSAGWLAAAFALAGALVRRPRARARGRCPSTSTA
jgi:hypothetical protein